MSGGVDSSVVAHLLKDQGLDVFGIHMQNWDEEEERGAHTGPGHCSSAQDLLDVRATCEHIGIELHHVKFVREYWNDVFEPFVQGYMDGVTPNPDIACNREIKFKKLLEHARSLGASTLATGHYARLDHSGATSRLLKAVDEVKDQTYFLSTVPAHALRRALFPLGALRKDEVRDIALRAGLPTARKRESMGICFVGKRRSFGDFLSEYVPEGYAAGNLVSVEDGAVLGTHRGAFLYTPGQGARLGGAPGKWFVAGKRGRDVLLALGTHHPALFADEVLVGAAPPRSRRPDRSPRQEPPVREDLASPFSAP
jgi:tRNA (5-methylaminomethyl-2-thiouridylate)-methyltransferase